jgi:hypothetical protein
MSINDKFRRDIKRIVTKAKERNDVYVRKFVADVLTRMVLKSPVDTGRFRANFVVGYGTPNYTTTEDTDKSGAISIAKAATMLSQLKADGITYVTNSLPYAQRLEYGWSQQAPAGYARTTAEEMRAAAVRIGLEVKAL